MAGKTTIHLLLASLVLLSGGATTALAQEGTDAAQATATSKQPKKKRPPVARVRGGDNSNPGYIDSALVGTRLRIRFDAAFDGNRADRAEVFYGKCACFGAVANQDGAGSPGPAESLDFQELEIAYEWALPQFEDRFSVFLEAPMRWIDVATPSNEALALNVMPSSTPRLLPPEITDSGLGDLRLGARYALVAAPGRAWTLQLRAYLPTGKADRGLGTDHASVEPAILAYKRLRSGWILEGELRYWFPLSGSPDPVTVVAGSRAGMDNQQLGPDPDGPEGPDEPTTVDLPPGLRVVPGSDGIVGTEDDPDDPVDNDNFAGDVIRFGIGASYEFSPTARIRLAPVAELVGWHVLGGFATKPDGVAEDATGTTIANLKLGLRLTGPEGRSVFVSYGKALTSDDIWYDDILRIEYRQPLSWQ